MSNITAHPYHFEINSGFSYGESADDSSTKSIEIQFSTDETHATEHIVNIKVVIFVNHNKARLSLVTTSQFIVKGRYNYKAPISLDDVPIFSSLVIISINDAIRYFDDQKRMSPFDEISLEIPTTQKVEGFLRNGRRVAYN